VVKEEMKDAIEKGCEPAMDMWMKAYRAGDIQQHIQAELSHPPYPPG